MEENELVISNLSDPLIQNSIDFITPMLHQIAVLIILSILGFFAFKLFNKWKARQISNDEYILAKKYCSKCSG